ACGEWDYLTYTYMYQPTIQSFTANAANYQENGMSPDSFSYITSSAYQLTPHKQYYIVNDDTISYSSATIGLGGNSSFIPFNTSFVNAGWNSVACITPFYWDGISNVVLEVTYNNTASSNDYSIASDVAAWQNSINTSGNERSAHFNDANYISIPSGAFASVDS